MSQSPCWHPHQRISLSLSLLSSFLPKVHPPRVDVAADRFPYSSCCRQPPKASEGAQEFSVCRSARATRPLHLPPLYPQHGLTQPDSSVSGPMQILRLSPLSLLPRVLLGSGAGVLQHLATVAYFWDTGPIGMRPLQCHPQLRSFDSWAARYCRISCLGGAAQNLCSHLGEHNKGWSTRVHQACSGKALLVSRS